MINNLGLIDELKKLLDDQYVYYCGVGEAFEIARSKTVEIILNIPYCFSLLGVLQKAGYINQIYMEEYKNFESKDLEFIKKYGKYDIVYSTEDGYGVAAIYDNKKFIKFFGANNDISLDEMVFDDKDNKPFNRYNNKMIELLKNLLDDEELEHILEVTKRTIANWRNKDELYNMMY